jgi:non-ribosomal peptide synthetase component E (peptide arylation enzyme)
MDAALLFLALIAAAALILALFRTRGAPTDAVFQVQDPTEVSVHEEAKTFSVDELPPELQAQGNELAQLALKGKAGGARLTQADKERMLELARTLAERAPQTSTAPVTHPGDGTVRLMHVETHTNMDFDS